MSTTTSPRLPAPVSVHAGDRRAQHPRRRLGGLSPACYPPVLAIAGVVALFHLAGSGFGLQRDELYFLAAGRRLAWGYVDQPPLVPLLARAADLLPGPPLLGLRLLSGAAHSSLVAIGAALAGVFGGGRRAQVLAAGSVACAWVFLVAGHSLSTTVVDQVSWAVVCLLLARALHGGGWTAWLPVGVALGVAVHAKHTVVLLVAGLAVGLAAARSGSLRTPGPWAAAAVAVVAALPGVWWQAAHGWPALVMLSSIQEGTDGLAARGALLPRQLLLVGPVLAPMWVSGLWWLLRAPAGRAHRPLGWACVAVLGLLLASGGKDYYASPLAVVLLAAGAVGAERRLRGGRGRAAVAVALIVGALPVAALLVPAVAWAAVRTLPVGDVVTLAPAHETVAEAVVVAHRSLPDGQRAELVLAASYEEAGALEQFAAPDLPPITSGHNAYWTWGPPGPTTAGGTVLAVGFTDPAELAELFDTVEPLPDGPVPMHRCSGPRHDWATAWPLLRSYRDVGGPGGDRHPGLVVLRPATPPSAASASRSPAPVEPAGGPPRYQLAETAAR